MTVKVREKQISKQWTSHCKAFHKGAGNDNWSFGNDIIGLQRCTQVAKVAMMQKIQERTHGRRAVAWKEAKGKRKVARERARACWTSGKTVHIAA